MQDAPKMMFSEELVASTAEGCEMMVAMVMDSLMSGEIPPNQIWHWYIRHLGYRYVLEEYGSVYAPSPESHERMQAIEAELALIRKYLAKNKQFVLAEELDTIMRTRLLHLPQAYVAQLEQRQ